MKESHSNYLKEKLDQIENRLQNLVEGHAAHDLHNSYLHETLAHDLVRTMRMHLAIQSDGKIIAPYQYIIHINPSHGKTWIPEQYFLDELAAAIKQAGDDAGLSFTSAPDMRLVADYDLSIDAFTIEITPFAHMTDDTTSIPTLGLESGSHEIEDSGIPDAFLIINSNDQIRLERAVINIGRNANNHVVIDDVRVSRDHAQLRLVKGQHVLFDLNSKGGTYINGRRVSQCPLNTGDVISLAGVLVIYVSNAPSPLANTDVIEVKPGDPDKDQPT